MRNWLEKNLKVISWTFTIFMFLFIYLASSLEFQPHGGVFSLGTKAILYHTSVFFALAMFLFISVWDIKKIGISLVIVMIYAVLDELHQLFVPGRFSSSIDVFIDFVGIALAFLIYLILITYRKKV